MEVRTFRRLANSRAGRVEAAQAEGMRGNPPPVARTGSGLLYPSNQSVDINRNQPSRGPQTVLLNRLLHQP